METLANGETKVELLTHVRYPLLKSGNDWTDWQKQSMKILFEIDKRIKIGYGLVCAELFQQPFHKRLRRITQLKDERISGTGKRGG